MQIYVSNRTLIQFLKYFLFCQTNMRADSKVMPSILLYWPVTSEANVYLSNVILLFWLPGSRYFDSVTNSLNSAFYPLFPQLIFSLSKVSLTGTISQTFWGSLKMFPKFSGYIPDTVTTGVPVGIWMVWRWNCCSFALKLYAFLECP